MKHYKILGLAGPAGAGKDTVGEMVRQFYVEHNQQSQSLSFASTLKAMLSAGGFPEPSDRARKEDKLEGFDFSWRAAAQQLGSEWGRSLDPDIWVKVVQAKITTEPEWVHVITDVRFENEARMVRSMGGEVWHLQGRKADLGDLAVHVSEIPVKHSFQDFVLTNDGDLQDLERSVKALLVGLT